MKRQITLGYFNALTLRAGMLSISLLLASSGLQAQTAQFTYQGLLNDGGSPAVGAYDLQFKLFDALAGGSQIGATLVREDVAVSNGLFKVTLDFGAGAFPGADRWLEIAVRPGASTGAFTTLSPLQQLNATPYAIRSLNATSADGLSVACVNCVTSGQINTVQGAQVTGGIAGSQVSGTIPVASVPAGSGYYVQNTTTPQASAHFNISGNGVIGGTLTAGTLSGNGANLTNLNASNLTSGMLATMRGGTGLGAAGATGNYLRSDGTNWTSSALQAADLPGGNASYIQNTLTQQAGANFNISGDGTAGGLLAGNLVNATTQYNLGGNRVLSAPAQNLFAGVLAGAANTTGFANSFFGYAAGTANTTGHNNSFFGTNAGSNTSNGLANAFFGDAAGFSNATGEKNSFFGSGAGYANTSGSNNTFVGYLTSSIYTTGSFNTALGAYADFGANNLTYATALGAGARVNTSNTIVLGRSNGLDAVTVPGSLTVAGSINAAAQYNLGGFRVLRASSSNLFLGWDSGSQNTTGDLNTFVGYYAGFANNTGGSNAFLGTYAGQFNTTGGANSFVGRNAGSNNTTGGFNTFLGYSAGGLNQTGSNNTFIGADAGTPSFSVQVNNSTAIGKSAAVSTDHTIVLGTSAETTRIPGRLGVGANVTPRGHLNVLSPAGNADLYLQAEGVNYGINFGVNSASPNATLFIAQFDGTSYQDRLVINPDGTVSVNLLGGAGATTLCRNASNEISTCSSSQRYKDRILAFNGGLQVIQRLQPVTFQWKASGARDLGLIAEEVAKVDPLLVTHNDKGEIEGVKYEQLSVVLINALKQQQTQLEQQAQKNARQQQQLQRQQDEIQALKRLVCRTRAQAAICRTKQ